MDNHRYHIPPHSQECLLAAGIKRMFVLKEGQPFSLLQKFLDQFPQSWFFGHLSYDLKNELESLESKHTDHIGFPDLCFFEPIILIRLDENFLTIEASEPEKIYREIISRECVMEENSADHRSLNILNRMSREQYLEVIQQLQQHILRGDCYEINYCQEFYAVPAQIEPVQVYHKLSQLSPNPFSALYRLGDKWMIGASPERFIKREGQKIFSQPIKGTSRRILQDATLDEENRTALYNSSKDRSENVMVVDLVRNDLARICKEGSVKVDELYGIYSFPQVHQMISTISGELQKEIRFSEIIRACFPMGSMTGAPKRSVLELIERYETIKRGIFSGALGYIAPSGDFDFNVVIRSILYNQSSQYLSFPTGSGITFYSDPAAEWEECLLKAEAIKKALIV